MPKNDAILFQHYRVLLRDDGKLDELGRGAMGVTYKATDTNLESLVALKVINAIFLDHEGARERFVHEARAAASLRHRNIASVYHLGRDAKNFFYAMEFIDGETLEHFVTRAGPLPWPRALAIILQVTRALMAAHEKRLIHRDIKPANIMLVAEVGEDERVVKLIDFGLAKTLIEQADNALAKTHATGFLGTPLYASPEQCHDHPLDVRSDIYSLGVTFWFTLTGKPTFGGCSILEIQTKHVAKPPPLEELEAVGVPGPVCDLLGRMLAKDAANRPQTPAELRREIEDCRCTVLTKEGTGVCAAGQTAVRSPEPYRFTLADLLVQRGRLDWEEVRVLIAPLAAVIDRLALNGPEALAGFAPRRVQVIFPTIMSDATETVVTGALPRLAWAYRSPASWRRLCPDFRLEMLRLPESRHVAGAASFDQTMLPVGRRFQDAPQALGASVYELLSGAVSGSSPKPLGELSAAANEILRHALLPTGTGYRGSADGLHLALEHATNLPEPIEARQPITGKRESSERQHVSNDKETLLSATDQIFTIKQLVPSSVARRLSMESEVDRGDSTSLIRAGNSVFFLFPVLGACALLAIWLARPVGRVPILPLKPTSTAIASPMPIPRPGFVTTPAPSTAVVSTATPTIVSVPVLLSTLEPRTMFVATPALTPTTMVIPKLVAEPVATLPPTVTPKPGAAITPKSTGSITSAPAPEQVPTPDLGREDSVILNNRGRAFERTGDYSAALREYDEAIESDGQDAVALYNRGNVYYRLRKYSQALDDYDEAIRYQPGIGVFHLARASVYRRLGRFDESYNDELVAKRLGKNVHQN